MNATIRNWGLLILLSGIWGASFILMKLSMQTVNGEAIFNSVQVGSLRMFIASLVLLPFAIKAFGSVNNWRLFVKLLAVGLFGNFFPAFLFTYAETGISSGYTGMLNSFTPIFALVISIVFFRERLSNVQYVGSAVGIFGIVMLSLASGDSFEGGFKYVLMVILATLCYAISLNVIKYMLKGVKSIHITALAFSTIFIPSIFVVVTSDVYQTIRSNEFAYQGLVWIFILSVIGTALAVFLFNVLISNSSVVFASSVTYLIPIFALLFGLLYGEEIVPLQILGMCIVLFGVLMANGKLKRNHSK